jgi:hypothetical protein
METCATQWSVEHLGLNEYEQKYNQSVVKKGRITGLTTGVSNAIQTRVIANKRDDRSNSTAWFLLHILTGFTSIQLFANREMRDHGFWTRLGWCSGKFMAPVLCHLLTNSWQILRE